MNLNRALQIQRRRHMRKEPAGRRRYKFYGDTAEAARCRLATAGRDRALQIQRQRQMRKEPAGRRRYKFNVTCVGRRRRGGAAGVGA